MAALSVIITAAVIKALPDQIPMHYDFQGNVDRFGSKYELFIYPGLMVIMVIMWMLMLRYFRKKAESEDEKAAAEAKMNVKVIYISSIIMMLMELGFQISAIVTALKFAENPVQVMPREFSSWIFAILGTAMMVMGNFMPKTKRNAIFGLRTVWSVKNDKVWLESNRFAGVSFFICGLFMTASAFLLEGMNVANASIIILLVVTVSSVIYSYIAYKKYSD